MKLMIFFFGLFFSALSLCAQDERLDEFSFDEQQFEQKNLYFGIGGGYSGSFFIQDMSDINQFLNDMELGLDDFQDNMYHHGLEIMSSTIIVPNTRIGFFRYSGSSDVSGNLDINGENFTRTVEISNFMTGVPFEYAFLPFKSFAIIPSVAIGYGSYDIDIATAPGEISLDGIKTGTSSMDNLHTTYWFAMPRLHIEYAFTQFTVIRLSAFYMASFAQDWKYNKEATLNDIPAGFNPNGYALQIGLFLGLFNY